MVKPRTQKIMTENYFSRIYSGLVRRRHDALVAAGQNPNLADVRGELLRHDTLRLSENEIGALLIGSPLNSGRRGHTARSAQADSASRRAARASIHAEEQDDAAAHFDAQLAHFAAAAAHRTASEYHTEQSEHHRSKANPKTQTDESPADTSDTGADDGDAVAASASEPADAPLCCARSLPSLLADGVPENVIMYMPGGVFSICPSRAGKPCPVTVLINEETADAMERQRAIMAEGGNIPFFSLEHESDIAAFWPTNFFWAVRPDATGKIVAGVWAKGEWTQAGLDAVQGRNYRSFSPTFFTNKIVTDAEHPAIVICNPNARLNLGSILNDPAFGANMSPLWPDNQPRA